MTEKTTPTPTDDPMSWLEACPQGELRQVTFGDIVLAIDRREVGIHLDGGASCVQTVCLPEARQVSVSGGTNAEIEADPAIAALRVVQTLAPDPRYQDSYSSYQNTIRSFVKKWF